MKTNKDLVIFTHTVNTGGSTFRDFLCKYNWQHEGIASLNIADVLVNTSLDTPMKRRHYMETVMLDEYTKKKNKINLIYGHHHLGMNRENLFTPRNVKYIVLLRDPIKRFIAHSHYLLTSKEIVNELINHPEVDFNLQTTYVSGIGCQKLMADKTDLENAKSYLEKYFFIGLMEQYDASVELFCKQFQLPFNGYTYNTHRVTKVKNKIPNEVIEILKEKCKLDIELYEFGKSLFEKKLEAYKNTASIVPTTKDKVLFFLKTYDLNFAKLKRKIQDKIRPDINQQKTIVDILKG